MTSNLARHAFAITPNDATDLAQQATGLWVGVLGDIVVIMASDGSSVTLKGAQGAIPIIVRRVLATGTTATDIVGFR